MEASVWQSLIDWMRAHDTLVGAATSVACFGLYMAARKPTAPKQPTTSRTPGRLSANVQILIGIVIAAVVIGIVRVLVKHSMRA